MAKSQQDENKAIVHAITKATNQLNVELLLKLLSPELKVYISGAEKSLNREEYIQTIRLAHAAFSDLKFTSEDILGEGEKVAVRLHVTGKHTGEFRGFAATHHTIDFYSIIIRRITNKVVVEEWQVNDHLTLMQQIGLLINHII